MDTVHVEVDGIPVDVRAESLGDFEMLEWMADITDGNILSLPKFARRFFGEEQFTNVKESLRNEEGVCDVADMTKFVLDCMQAAAEAKKAELKN